MLKHNLKGVRGLATVESADLGAAIAGADEIARDLVAEEHWHFDIFTAAPEGARWKAEELTSQLLYQQAYEPQGEQRVLIITYAHLMDARLHDQLLKVVEEPVAPVLFLFVVDNSEALPTTIQSRIYERIVIPARNPESIAHNISEAAGTQPSSGVVHLSQHAPTISAGLVGDKATEVLSATEDFIRHLHSPGFTAGWKANDALKALAKATSDAGAEAPKTKAAQREGLRAGLVLLEQTALRGLAQGTDEQAAAADIAMRRLKKAAWLSDSHLPIEQVLVYTTTGGEL